VKLKTSALFSLHNGNFTPISLFDLKKNSVNYHHSTLSLRILSLNCWLGQSLEMMIAGIKVVEWQ